MTEVCNQPSTTDNKCDLCLSVASFFTPIKACSTCTRKLICKSILLFITI